MPKRGGKPKPTRLKVIAGNPGGRPLPEEPNIPPGVPIMPDWLDEIGREEWQRVVDSLGPVGVLRNVDATVLSGYCDAVSRARKASLRARTDISSEARAEKAWMEVRHYAAIFGIGPAEASRVVGREAPRDSENARLVK